MKSSFWCCRSVTLALVFAGVALSDAGSSRYHTRGGHSNSHHADMENMNGDYVLSSTPGSNNTNGLFPTHYKDYPHLPIESFDVYSPNVSQLYSQVFWKGLPPVSLPEDIVSKFSGKVMAVVGFELDQVMDDPVTGEEMSVPMTALYNHHFESTMIGGNSARFELTSPDDPRVLDYAQQKQQQEQGTTNMNMGHGIPPHQPYWLVVGDDVSATGQPTRQDFGAANGGEMRKSFHGYAPGFAQLIESPRQFQVTPMQIDTWHREAMDLRNCSRHFVPGPLPRNSQAPPDAKYSGLLECPVTTRIHKHLPPQGIIPLASGTCSRQGLIINSDDCYKAVVDMVKESDAMSQVQKVSGTDDSRPLGCSARVVHVANEKENAEGRVIEAYFRDSRNVTTTTTDVEASNKDIDCGSGSTQSFSAVATSLVNVSVTVDLEQDVVALTLVGPADVWFGVGFGADSMGQKPWTIVVYGDDDEKTIVTERKLDDHAPGSIISPPTVHVASSVVDTDNNIRSVTLTRSVKGHYFSFHTKNVTEIPFINAVGSSQEFGYHENKEASNFLLLPVASSQNGSSSGMCVCQTEPPPFGKAKGGMLEYKPVEGQPGEKGVAGKVRLDNRCDPFPRTVLLEQQNPTCDIRTYTGGQVACHHMWSLLDADQSIPWVGQPLEYRLKFRFWVQEFDESYHTNVHRTTWGIASPTEYDVPKCEEGVPGCSKEIDPATGKERWIHTIRGTFQAGNAGKLVAAHFHCHAPTCLTTSLYLCEDGDAQGCDEHTGTLLCQEDTIRGDGAPGKFTEPGFATQPPCLWGSSEFGLEPPPDVRGKTLFAKKTADSNSAHHGEMAWFQMLYV